MSLPIEEGVECKKFKNDSDIPNKDEVHCNHWVKRKKRFCKMTVVPSFNYCGEHKPVNLIGKTKEHGLEKYERIICPLDSKHTVYINKLQKHLKICNARQRDDLPSYIVKGVNVGDSIETDEFLEECTKLKLSELGDEEFYDVINKVKSMFAKYVEGSIENIHCQHKLLENTLANKEYGNESRKHLVQTAALLGVIEEKGQLQPSTSFIEFGAGKGQLAFYLAQLLQNTDNSQVVLLDRMSLRNKKDNKIENKSLVHRIRVDIGDLNLHRLDLLEKTKRNVAFSKHLCGGATDLTLRCITRNPEGKSNEKAGPMVVDFVMIALCCHHRCDWRSFVGKEFMESHGIDARKFTIITKMVSWAICGSGMSRERRRIMAENKCSETEELNDVNVKQRLSLEEREKIGFMCKRILDYARIQYLQNNGYEASLVYYVAKSVTLENVCLLAKKLS